MYNPLLPKKQEFQCFKGPEAPSLAKAVVPAGEFMSANILPKGTSVRKKFVPPFKKPDPALKEVEEKDEEACKEPAYKNL